MNKSVIACTIALGLAACVGRIPEPELSQRAEAMLKSGFSGGDRQLAARVEQQDETQELCSRFKSQPPKDVAEKIEKSQMVTIQFPARLMGDWKRGEKIAQDGYGMRFTDPDPKKPNGGNCYACHQLAPQELSYGTLGPSLYRFGKLRGNSEATQKYAYGKVYNAQAYLACSNMPRFGHNKVLTPEQIADVVALLLDPASPVNQ